MAAEYLDEGISGAVFGNCSARQIVQGLDGDPRAALKARLFLRELFCGRIDLTRGGDELWAECGFQPLLQIVENYGSEVRI